MRFNLFPAADLNGTTAPGYSTGQSLATMESLVVQNLPSGFGYEWTEMAFQEKQAGNTIVFLFPLAVLFVFLWLAAQYESWLLPLAIILIVPLCLLFALVGVWFRSMDNNVLTQIGFIVLIGLACKNAILIVEFAKAEEDKGKDRFQAAIDACCLRWRHFDDRLLFHPRRYPFIDRHGCRIRDATRARYDRLQRDAGSNPVRTIPDPCVLCSIATLRS